MLEELDKLNLSGEVVGIVHYGEHNGMTTDALRERGAKLYEPCLYMWLLPADLSALQNLIDDCLRQRVDVVAFTS